MIRPAVVSDLPRMEAMGAEFFTAAQLDQWFSYKPHCFSKVTANLMASDDAVVLVGDRQTAVIAMAAAMAYPCWFDTEHLTCQELFWWVDPLQRGGTTGATLMRGLEDWAREKGCLTMEMGALDSSRWRALANLYERKGYGPKEHVFIKRLI